MKHLFKVDASGSIRQWTIEQNVSEVIVTHGLADGQKITNVYEAQPKNIGRSNETTAIEQAKLEIQSLIDKQLRLGYYKSIDDAKKYADKFKAMKLHKAVEEDEDNSGNLLFTKYFNDLPDEVFAQIKYNGVWCAIENISGELVFLSRGNTTYDYMNESNIAKELIKVLPEGVKIIGEIYNHDYHESQVAGTVKRSTNFDENSLAMLNSFKFVVYDVYFDSNTLNKWSYEAHMDYAKNLVRNLKQVFVIKSLKISKYRVLEILEGVKAAGMEGLVIRNPNCKYQPGKRSTDVLKVKSFDTQDYKIFDVTLSPKGVTIFHLVDPNDENIKFTATINADVEVQGSFYQKRDYYIGQMASVRYAEMTINGKPKFPKIIEVFPADVKG